ncbi:cupin domain-containing protein [Candidatus Woesearchaeota archaeon]|nr:cupin domain-containing protein [Candidatus Woesearchaeota archaeon]
MKGFKTNIEKDTVDNEFYRKVLYTGKKMQLVVMSLKVGDDIPSEVHPDIDQFIRVETGKALVTIDGNEMTLEDDDIVIVPAGSEHYVKNSGDKPLKIYTIYTPPEHPDGTVHKTREEALEHEH